MRFRIICLGVVLVWLAVTTAQAEPAIRVGSLRYGTLSWELDVIAHHGLDEKHGVRIDTLELAGSPAGQLALQAGRVDMIVSDWLWVSRQRAAGAELTCVPFSSAIGSLIVPSGSTIRELPGLAAHRLGIAGSAIDKSWLILQLYARSRFGFDIDKNVDKSFGAPPLLNEELEAGRLDAVLTYWPFAARLEARGMRPVVTIGDALAGLGITRGLPLTVYVFSAGWAADNRAAERALDQFWPATGWPDDQKAIWRYAFVTTPGGYGALAFGFGLAAAIGAFYSASETRRSLPSSATHTAKAFPGLGPPSRRTRRCGSTVF